MPHVGPGIFSELRKAARYIPLITTLTRKELKGRYRGSILGFFWSILDPVLLVLIYTLVFSIFMRIKIESYHVFLLAGIFAWNWFISSLNDATVCIRENQPLIKKVCVSPDIFIFASGWAQCINFFFNGIIFCLFLIVSGYGLSVSVLFFPLLIIIEFVLIMGISFCFSAYSVRYRDFQYLIRNLSILWFFATPVIYTLDYIPAHYRWLIYINPIPPLIICYQDIFYYKTIPDFHFLLISTVYAGVLFITGYLLFNRIKYTFVEEL